LCRSSQQPVFQRGINARLPAVTCRPESLHYIGRQTTKKGVPFWGTPNLGNRVKPLSDYLSPQASAKAGLLTINWGKYNTSKE